jgi:hypothetical protein
VNVVFNVVPSVLTIEMMATEMPAAIRPYSMAVAAVSSCQKVSSDFMSIRIRRNLLIADCGNTLKSAVLLCHDHKRPADVSPFGRAGAVPSSFPRGRSVPALRPATRWGCQANRSSVEALFSSGEISQSSVSMVMDDVATVPDHQKHAIEDRHGRYGL